MADGHRECIGRIGRQPHVDLQQLLDHVGDLVLLRTTHSHDCELDRARRVLVHAERLRHGRECRTTGLAQLERAVGVLGHEYAFDGNFLWRMLRDQLRDSRMDQAQPVGQRSARGGDAALRDDAQSAGFAVDDAEAGAQASRIETEDARRTTRRHARENCGGSRARGGPESAPG